MHFGVQTRPWGPERNRTDLNSILAEIAGAGYTGFEIGAQHLDLNAPATFRQLLAAHGLRVVGLHVGGEIYNPQAVTEALANLERTIAFAAEVGATYLPFSGKMKGAAAAESHKTETELSVQAESLNRIGELARAAGLSLCYHNHFWEIEANARELRHLLAHTDPTLVSLCLDVAWVQRGGSDPVALAREVFDRVGYFHFKDTTADEWMELGRGIVDLPGLAALLDERRYNGWIVVEQDETRGPAVESATISRAYLQELLGI